MAHPPASPLFRQGNVNLAIGGAMVTAAAILFGFIGFSQQGNASTLRLAFYFITWLVALVGCGLAFWGVVCHVAHRQVEANWCPDRDAHTLPPPGPAPSPQLPLTPMPKPPAAPPDEAAQNQAQIVASTS